MSYNDNYGYSAQGTTPTESSNTNYNVSSVVIGASGPTYGSTGAIYDGSGSAYGSGGAAYRSSSAGSVNFQSHIEQSIINSTQPIVCHETTQISAGHFHGIHVNREECDSFRTGCVPLAQYPIHNDPNPEVIHKRIDRGGKTVQEVSVRYLNPPPAPKPGDLIIREKATTCPPAPPVIIRVESAPLNALPPQVCREHPPNPPPAEPEQIIEVPGPSNAPPPRRVIVEKIASVQKPQSILIEKWLPYKHQPRRVIYQRAAVAAAQHPPRNLIIEWEHGNQQVEQVCNNLGVQDMDPHEYIRRYGAELKSHCEIPNLCKHLHKTQSVDPGPELVGDISALKFIKNLHEHGLDKYAKYVQH